MAEKKNFWTRVMGAMNGAISYGALSVFKDHTSSIRLQALDGRHFFEMGEQFKAKNNIFQAVPFCSRDYLRE